MGNKAAFVAAAKKSTFANNATTAPHLIVIANAGTGKTFTIVEGVKELLGIKSKFTPMPQQKIVWDKIKLSKGATTIQMVAFNKLIANDFAKKLPKGVGASTMHSLGYGAVRSAFKLAAKDAVRDDRVPEIICELMDMDIRELRAKSFQTMKAVERLVGLCKQNLVGCGVLNDGIDPLIACPPTPSQWADSLDALAGHHDVEMNGNRDQVYDLVPRVLSRCLDVQKDLYIDFNDMVWLPVALDLPMVKNDLLLVDESQDLNRCQQALAKKAGKRLILVGDPNQCLLPGTMITVQGGEKVSIEELVKYGMGVNVLTFNPNGGVFAGRRTQGRKITAVNTDAYEGEIVLISSGDDSVSCTLNHKWWARFSKSTDTKACLYLMQRGNQFRIGTCAMKYSCGIGVAARSRAENADKSWILDIYDTPIEAAIMEEAFSAIFGLPQVVFQDRGVSTPAQEYLDSIYEIIGDNTSHAQKCLEHFGRSLSFPIWEKKSADRFNYLSTTKGFVVHATNLMDNCFDFRCDNGTKTGQWRTISVHRKDYSGFVYGITVEPTERDLRLYVANNFVSHNSIYGFAGADAESMARMQAELEESPAGCDIVPLTVTRRCGRSIVNEAKALVPSFEAHKSNCDGKIGKLLFKTETEGSETFFDHVTNGDMLLCRVNAPLVSVCMRLLKKGLRAEIQGRDIGQGLISTIKKMQAYDVPTFIEKLSDWQHYEVEKELRKRYPSDARIIAINDKHDCLICFAEGAVTVDDITAKIMRIFTDNRDQKGVLLSTIHRAKGLESKRVFLLEPEGSGVPHPMAKSQWQLKQEWNLRYVALTRAIEELYYVK